MRSVNIVEKERLSINPPAWPLAWQVEEPVIVDAMQSLAVKIQCRRGQQIACPEDPADHWYGVASGMAKRSAVLLDGRRRIVDFLLPGDFFGFFLRAERFFSVEAVMDGTVLARYPRRRLEMLADSTPEVGRQLRSMALESICRLQSRILLLGRGTAVEKVGSFLLEMEERSGEGRSVAVALPMSRYDIADYLALSVETVSRTLTDLKQRSAIALTEKHRVTILDRSALQMASCG